jgi:hypothetical protein
VKSNVGASAVRTLPTGARARLWRRRTHPRAEHLGLSVVRGLQNIPVMKRTKTASARAPRTLGDLIVACEDAAARSTRRVRDRRRLAALWVAISLIGSGNDGALRRLATAG